MVTETEIGSADKEEVREYFTNTGFGRWNKIYSDDDSVNAVQKDIREGHAKTVDTVRWPGGLGVSGSGARGAPGRAREFWLFAAGGVVGASAQRQG